MAMTEEAKYELAQRRVEFWAWAGRVAVGVFLGMTAWSILALAIFRLWLDAEVDSW